MIPLKTHNILDYVGAFVLIASPYLFNFSDVNTARNLFLTLGFVLAIYSALTQYQYTLAKFIPIRVHMLLDVVTGFVLMIGPYAFSYRAGITNGQTALHFVLGLGLWGLVALTRSRPGIIERDITTSDVTDIRRDRAA
jgi:hypothetical protein